MSTDNRNNLDDIIDFDELDELPDVVLGEKTRAMRVLHANGLPVENKVEQTTEMKVNEILSTDVTSDDFFAPSAEPIAEPVNDISLDEKMAAYGKDPVAEPVEEKTAEETAETEEESVEEVSAEFETPVEESPAEETAVDAEVQPVEDSALEEADTTVEEEVSAPDETADEKTEDEEHVDLSILDSIDATLPEDSFDLPSVRDLIDEDAVKAEIDNQPTIMVPTLDAFSSKPKEKKEALIDLGETSEIPPSVIDDDPRVDDELSAVYEPKQETDPLPRAKDELSEVLKQEENKNLTVTGKHARTGSVTGAMTAAMEQPAAVKPIEKPQPEYHFDNQEEKPKKKKRRRPKPFFKRFLQLLLVLLIAALGYGVWHIYDSLQPVTKEKEEVLFTVNDGDTLGAVAEDLQEAGIIKDSQIAYYYARLNHLTDVKQGLFTIDKSWDLKQLFTVLNDELAAKKDGVAVTITEGDWAKMAAKELAAGTNVSAEELMALWNNRDWISSQRENYPFITDEMFQDGVRIYLEGYLSPNTYMFNKETTAEEITTTILNQTLAIYNKNADRIAASEYSIHQIFTLASIVQYEAGGASFEDMQHVAGVFYNRLNSGMPLQSSVTVCYAIDFDQDTDNWTACEVNADYESPYNTYRNAGLTPGPIQNVGEQAFEAVLDPMETSDLYFMADLYGDVQDGKIYYAETLDGHNQNIANAKAS